MHLLIVSLCVAAAAVIVLEASPCSMEKRRDMLIKVCGDDRKKRESSLNDYFYGSETKRLAVNQNDIRFGETRRLRHLHIIANDDTGGILIRRKRGNFEDFMYCCFNLGNCTFIC